jgi:hypothetical protein
MNGKPPTGFKKNCFTLFDKNKKKNEDCVEGEDWM